MAPSIVDGAIFSWIANLITLLRNYKSIKMKADFEITNPEEQ